MEDSRNTYAEKAICQLPRLIGNQDRNSFSPTYGCFHRDYWLDKTSDFPDAVRQFGVHSLALVYKYDFPGNIYKGKIKIRDWAIAGMDFWAKIQHRDGSFDEFYPNERGWIGPTGFTTYSVIEAFNLLSNEVSADVKQRIIKAIRRAAYFISKGESEQDCLANHHAMACLAVWKASELLREPELKEGFQRLWKGFLVYHDMEEGWSMEYDGVDPGYLSATISFLAKIYKDNPNPDIFEVLRKSVEFCSYFVYPNGFYAGSIGSRNTQHFYPHGFEILAKNIPQAAAIAERMSMALKEGKLVPPEIMSDRYVFYRVPEFLQAYLDYTPRPEHLSPLPYQRTPFLRYFPRAGIYSTIKGDYYVVANLAKGGVVKVFNRHGGRLLLNDCGLIGQLNNGRVVTSQWISSTFERLTDEHGWQVRGHLSIVPTHKLFTPLKNLVFRAILLILGWNSRFSHLLKGKIRRALILAQRTVPVRFHRRFYMDNQTINLIDELHLEGRVHFKKLAIGDEFFVRFVPQSCYFQSQELNIQGYLLNESQTRALNNRQHLSIRQVIASPEQLSTKPTIQVTASSLQSNTFRKKNETPQMSINDVDYLIGRQLKRQLIYRLHRRTDEVEEVLRHYGDGRLQVVIDVGTADGLMLNELRWRMGPLTFLGIDLSFGLLRAYLTDSIFKAQGDAICMPVKTAIADAVIATAIIEHVPDASALLQECARMLRPGGLLVLTTPDPFMEHLASVLGLLKKAGHVRTFRMRELKGIVQANGFEILEARRFMFSPVGFPAEKTIERVLGPIGLKFLMANQLLVARYK